MYYYYYLDKKIFFKFMNYYNVLKKNQIFLDTLLLKYIILVLNNLFNILYIQIWRKLDGFLLQRDHALNAFLNIYFVVDSLPQP